MYDASTGAGKADQVKYTPQTPNKVLDGVTNVKSAIDSIDEAILSAEELALKLNTATYKIDYASDSAADIANKVKKQTELLNQTISDGSSFVREVTSKEYADIEAAWLAANPSKATFEDGILYIINDNSTSGTGFNAEAVALNPKPVEFKKNSNCTTVQDIVDELVASKLSNSIEISQSDYDALTPAQRAGRTYIINDDKGIRYGDQATDVNPGAAFVTTATGVPADASHSNYAAHASVNTKVKAAEDKIGTKTIPTALNYNGENSLSAAINSLNENLVFEADSAAVKLYSYNAVTQVKTFVADGSYYHRKYGKCHYAIITIPSLKDKTFDAVGLIEMEDGKTFPSTFPYFLPSIIIRIDGSLFGLTAGQVNEVGKSIFIRGGINGSTANPSITFGNYGEITIPVSWIDW